MRVKYPKKKGVAMLYVTRHGQTPWNVENIICGRTDVSLTDTGREQAREAGRSLAHEGVKFDRIIASPLMRAQETAKVIAREVGFDEDALETDERIIEFDFGEFEGIACDSELFLAYKAQPMLGFPGGESVLKVAQRTYNLIDTLKERAQTRAAEGLSEENVLLVCHGATARVINTYFEPMSLDDYMAWALGNACVEEYDFS